MNDLFYMMTMFRIKHRRNKHNYAHNSSDTSIDLNGVSSKSMMFIIAFVFIVLALVVKKKTLKIIFFIAGILFIIAGVILAINGD